MKTKLTVIVDNTPSGDIKGEWGLSILVEYGGKKILADAGASDLFAENMKAIGLDITDIDYATLSHAHYDHANGMPKFFNENKMAKLYIRETTAENCYEKVFFFHFGSIFLSGLSDGKNISEAVSDWIVVRAEPI